jgi:hypothetical protein
MFQEIYIMIPIVVLCATLFFSDGHAVKGN